MASTQLLGGRYRLVERLGEGGTAVVWRAYDEVLGRRVAVKVLSAEYAADANFRARIRTEAQAAAGLNHPYVTNVHDYGESAVGGERVPYVVMELLAGPTLAERMQSGPLPVSAALRIATHVAQALAAAHARGLVHCDIKPANVVLTPGGAKVVDFGISAVAGQQDPQGTESLIWGTPAYIAPERLAGRRAVAATDVYALGLVLYHALSGVSPWRAETTTQMLIAHATEEPAPLPPIADLPPRVAVLCGQCLAKDPLARPTAAEMARVLLAARAELGADVPPPGAGSRSARPSADRVDDSTTDARPVPVALPSPQRHTGGAASKRRRRGLVGSPGQVLIILAAALIGGYLAFSGSAPALPDAEPLPPGQSVAPSTSGEPESGTTAGPTGPAVPTGPKGATGAGAAPAASPALPHNGAGRIGGPGGGGSGSGASTTPGTGHGSGGGSSGGGPRPVERTVSTLGGTVAARCVGSTASIVSASPLTGFAVSNLNRGPGTEVGVTFNALLKTVRVVVHCSSGVPTDAIQVS